MSVRENLKLALLKSKNRDREEEMIERIGHYFPVLKQRLYPGGRQSQRRGTTDASDRPMPGHRPEIMLIDEPTEGLMPILVELIGEIVLTIHREGVTVLLVEQNMEMALSISHRAYVMDEGRIQTFGPARRSWLTKKSNGATFPFSSDYWQLYTRGC